MLGHQVGEALTVDQDDPVLDVGHEDLSGMASYRQPLPSDLMRTMYGFKRFAE